MVSTARTQKGLLDRQGRWSGEVVCPRLSRPFLHDPLSGKAGDDCSKGTNRRCPNGCFPWTIIDVAVAEDTLD